MRKIVTAILCFLFLQKPILADGTTWKTRRKNDMLQVGILKLPDELDPTSLRLMSHFLMLQCSCQTLVRVSESGEIVSDLAKHWSFKNEGKEITFSIQPDAVFQDQRPVTASDVVSSFNRHLQKGSKSLIGSYLENLLVSNTDGSFYAAIKEVDKLTVKFFLKSHYPPIMNLLAMPGFCILPAGFQPQEKKVIGSGPLKAEYIEKEQKWSFHKWVGYRGNLSIHELSIKAIDPNKSLKSQFDDGSLDVALVVNMQEAEALAKQSDVVVTHSQSLMVMHGFINKETNVFKNKEFRKDFGAIVKSIAHSKLNMTQFHHPINTYLPTGIMPREYYEKRGLETLSQSEFIRKWKTYLMGKELKSAFLMPFFTESFIEDFKKVLTAAGLKVSLASLNPGESSEKFDFVGTGYVGNFPDPDAFIDPLREDTPFKFTNIESNKFLSKLSKIRFIEPSAHRLQLYAESFKEFEELNFIVPMYSISMPIVHRKEIQIPSSNFRYESELWKIFWKKL